MSATATRVLRNASKLLTGDAIASLLGLYTLLAMTRAMEASQFGKWIFVQGLVLLIGGVFSFQSWQMLIKYGAPRKNENDPAGLSDVVTLAAILDLTGAIFSYVFLVALTILFLQNGLLGSDQIAAAMIYSVAALLNIKGMATGVLRLFDRYHIFSVSRVVGAVLRAVFIQVLIFNNVELFAIALIWLFSDIVERAILNVYAIRVLRSKDIPLRIDFTAVKALLSSCYKFVIQTTVQTGIRTATNRIDVVILGALLGYATLAQYRVLRQVGQIISKVVSPFYQSIYPELVDLVASGKKEELFRSVRKIVQIFGFLSVLAILPLMIWGDSAISLIFGPEYKAPTPSLALYCAGIFVLVVTFPMTPLLVAHGKTSQTLMITLISSVAYLVMLVILTLHFEIIGATSAFLLFWLLWAGLSLREVLKLAKQ